MAKECIFIADRQADTTEKRRAYHAGRCLVGGLIVMMSLVSNGLAQDQTRGEAEPVQLGPTTVTAQKVEQSAEEIPVAITVIDGESARDGELTSVREASLLVPNVLVIEPGTVNFGGLFIRGVGSAARGDNSVALYIDDVPQFDSTSIIRRLNPMNIERFEFIRGPQATLYGRNSLGGVINLLTPIPDPSGPLIAYASGTAGNYDLREGRVGFTAPLIEDQLAIGIDGLWMHRESYFENTFPGNRTRAEEDLGLRARLHYEPDDRFAATLTLWAEDHEGTGFAFAPIATLRDDPHTFSHDFESRESRELLGAALRLSHDFGPVTLMSITTLQRTEADNRYDRDFTPLDILVQDSQIESMQFAQEVRLSSSEPMQVGQEARLSYLAGVFIGVTETEERFVDAFGVDGSPMLVGIDRTRRNEADLFNVGVFGQATLTLWDVLDLTAGLRLEYDRRTIDTRESSAFGMFPIPGSVARRDFSRSDTEWLPTFAAAWRVDPSVMLYGRIAKGFRAGGFNDDSALPNFEFDQETLWSFEAGVKTTWLDGRLLVNATAFYIDHEDLQLLLFDPLAQTFTIRNSGDARTYGAELEVVALPLGHPGLQVFGSLGWLDARFDGFDDPVGGTDGEGKRVPFAPQWTWSLGVQAEEAISSRLSLFGRASLSGYGRQAFTPDNSIEQGSYEVLSLRGGLRGEHWRIELWMNNALDENYLSNGFVGLGGTPFGSNGPPRTYGVTATIEF